VTTLSERGLLVDEDPLIKVGIASGGYFDYRHQGAVTLGSMLPAIYQQLDPTAVAFTEALDEVLAPVWLSIDNVESYFDPLTAPADFVAMLADWVSLAIDDNWTEDETRRLVAHAVELYRWAGTPWGIASMVAAYTGVYPQVIDSGGTIANVNPMTAPPGEEIPAVRVVVALPPAMMGQATGYAERLQRLVLSVVPAHVAVRIDVTPAA
jgi:phage tail-like protein